MFYYIDLFLPRSLVVVPYLLAAFVLKHRIETIKGTSVWFRNSFASGDIVFGVSDLDISIKLDEYDLDKVEQIKYKVSNLKNFFPFLGEINFYVKGQFELLSESLNLFEKKRDPVLDSLLIDSKPFGEKIEKLVFLLRMLNSDKKNLTVNPEIRQKKWKKHFTSLSLQVPDFIDRGVIIETIINLINSMELSVEIRKALEFLFSPELSNENVFQIVKPELWKFVFPNLHIWHEDLKLENLDNIINSPLKDICIRQIDWEIWGIYSQLPFIPNENGNIKVHIERLAKVAKVLSQNYDLSIRANKLVEYSIKI